MAGYITSLDGKVKEFHLGRTFTREEVDYTSELQLDGHELEHVQTKMSNLPQATGRVVNYYGDHAKFILGNW